MRVTTLLLLLACALPLFAQVPPTPDPSAEKESFTIQPGSVDRGVRNFAVRLVANKAAGFSNSSSKAPVLKFSAGVTLVAGSLQILNQNEAQANIDVDNDAAGTIEVKLELYSVNGSSVLKTLRATLGIKGTSDLPGSQAEVGAESVKLVQVNVAAPQAAGALLVTGKIAGTVRIKAPTGTNFSSAPVATIDSGDINSPALEQTNTVFTFSIGNAALDDVTVRVDSILYNTQFFGLVAQQGDLVCELTGAALANQTALVVNAFTAKTEVAGSNDNSEDTGGNNNSGGNASENSNSTAQSGGTPNAVLPQGRTLDNNSNNRPERNRNRNNNTPGGSSRPLTSQLGGGSAQGGGQVPPPRFDSPDVGAAPGPVGGAGGAVAAPSAGNPGGAGLGGTGSITNEKSDGKTGEGELETRKVEAKELEITPGLHFCDKDFKPVSALVLDKAVAGEAGGRVWIVLKLKTDKQPDKIETVTVKLTVNGITRELTLTETGKHTGEFRCGKDGILVIANENPDSNEPEKATAAPKPRFDR